MLRQPKAQGPESRFVGSAVLPCFLGAGGVVVWLGTTGIAGVVDLRLGCGLLGLGALVSVFVVGVGTVAVELRIVEVAWWAG